MSGYATSNPGRDLRAAADSVASAQSSLRLAQAINWRGVASDRFRERVGEALARTRGQATSLESAMLGIRRLEARQ